MKKKAPKKAKVLKGFLFDWFETGLEGIEWAFQEKILGAAGYEGLNILEDGDILTVYNEENNIIFKGTIKKIYSFDKEYKKLIKKTKTNLRFSWLQKDVDLFNWALMFRKQFNATLIKYERNC